ncbi:MAG: aldolase/citrate lyase family protein [Sphingomonas sp.]
MTAFPRSWLFTPGSRPDRFAKAAAGPADGLILDLEDAVAEDRKVEARGHVFAWLGRAPDIRQRVAVRINPLGRATGLEDLAAIAGQARAPDYILIPKAEEPAELALAARVLEDAGSPARLAALVESALGIARAADIARATPRLAALFFGAADYAADLGRKVGVFRPDFARAAVVNAAAAAGIVAIDSPFFAIDAPEALAVECRHGRATGFHGKAAIHPAQIDAIATAFAPSAAEREQARAILAAAPDGVGTLDGKMIDIAMVRWARRIA